MLTQPGVPADPSQHALVVMYASAAQNMTGTHLRSKNIILYQRMMMSAEKETPAE